MNLANAKVKNYVGRFGNSLMAKQCTSNSGFTFDGIPKNVCLLSFLSSVRLTNNRNIKGTIYVIILTLYKQTFIKLHNITKTLCIENINRILTVKNHHMSYINTN